MFATAILAHAIAAHMRFRAGDLLEGREPGTRGYNVAAEYVAAQFEAIGLETSQQPITFRVAKLQEDQSSYAVGGQPLTIRKDSVPRANFLEAWSEVIAPVVLVGFGIVAPELKHDDYAGIDAKGKIVLMLSGAPPNFPLDQRAYYSGSRLKERTAAKHGAVGVLTLNTITDEKRQPFEKRAQQIGIPPMLYLDQGRPADAVDGIRVSAQLSQPAAAKFLANVDAVLADAEKGVTHSMDLSAPFVARTISSFTEVKSENVIGVLPGQDPKLRNEFVAVTAHLDHLGNHPPANGGDSIYNGAYDNASGIACLIEIARGLAGGPRPKRSVALVAVTGEEKGLQGSEYFVRHPVVRPIVADINMDMFLMLYPVADLIALGGEHTTIGAMAAQAAKQEGFQMSPDPFAEEVRFIRSDQFSFVEAGIPAIHLKPGNKSRDPKIDGASVTKEWLQRVYHSPADDMNQPFDFASGARYADTNLRLVGAIANAEERPAWKKGDFFAPRATPTTFPINRFDTNHSTILFRIPILGGMSEVAGKFTDFSAQVVYDSEHPTSSSVVATIKTASIDTGIAARDQDLRSANFFDAEKFPEIRYESSRIEKTADGYRCLGKLTMHGVTKPLDLRLRMTGLTRVEEKKSVVIGFGGNARLNRRDYGINWKHSADPLFVGDDVVIEIHLISRL